MIQLSFITDIYCLHGKLTAVWKFTSVNLTQFNFAWSHVNVDNEVTLNQSEILPWSEISKRFAFTSGLM